MAAIVEKAMFRVSVTRWANGVHWSEVTEISSGHCEELREEAGEEAIENNESEECGEHETEEEEAVTISSGVCPRLVGEVEEEAID